MKYKCSRCNHIQRSSYRPTSCPNCSSDRSSMDMTAMFILLSDDSCSSYDSSSSSSSYDSGSSSSD